MYKTTSITQVYHGIRINNIELKIDFRRALQKMAKTVWIIYGDYHINPVLSMCYIIWYRDNRLK